ncbi:hypothetical protein HT745_06675 [Pseudosulfitobacter pseudonitzschiae]|uniref:hypothetical protein n=1 Tax=Pseudosulfitobacter pseudonitzschiae TaxID=1402135 RepID=UPI0015821B42|nr:hypothetical protein [Pseudosulfitobacter pseudonitzschiae]QKS08193.1 hypothetical protein HT745_06675 [Pseudosulfitobacter pseudonitzschiae]
MKKLVGKIISLSLKPGLVYGVCTHSLQNEGEIILLYDKIFSHPLRDPEAELAGLSIRTALKFPLRYLLKEPEINIVGERDLTDDEKKLPVFKSPGIAKAGELPNGWWLVDEEDEIWVDALSHEMAYYPNDGIYNLPAISYLYESNLYPYSEHFLKRGPLNFSLSQV